jgi:hypothetical protein
MCELTTLAAKAFYHTYSRLFVQRVIFESYHRCITTPTFYSCIHIRKLGGSGLAVIQPTANADRWIMPNPYG